MCRNVLWKLLVPLLLAVIHSQARPSRTPHKEKDGDFWREKAERDILEALHQQQNTNAAKNVIVFVGDGMGISTVTAARIFKGQELYVAPGEETVLAWEQFPNVALSKVPDSAATATAFLCGVKTNYATVGVDGHVSRGQCKHMHRSNVTCIAQLMQQAGKATGVVTGSRITHATPAPLYARSADRMWESSVPPAHRHSGCTDIAQQLLSPPGQNLNVILGGGRRSFMPLEEVDPEYPDKFGEREDRRNIIDEWMDGKRRQGQDATYVWKQEEFDQVDTRRTNNLIGLFEPSHMQYAHERHLDKAGEPSLAELVTKAIDVLKNNKKGFFLLVEGARIDHGHHYNVARKALEETVALEEAVEAALQAVSLDDTLMIVTADHSHPLTIGSYATRGNPILGLTDYSDDKHRNGTSFVDGLPYTTLSYANGPAAVRSSPRPNLTHVDTEDREYMQTSSVPAQIVSHDGSDVAIYAAGPFSHLFNKVHEQNYIFHVMTHAACIGPYRQHCPPASQQQQQPQHQWRRGTSSSNTIAHKTERRPDEEERGEEKEEEATDPLCFNYHQLAQRQQYSCACTLTINTQLISLLVQAVLLSCLFT